MKQKGLTFIWMVLSIEFILFICKSGNMVASMDLDFKTRKFTSKVREMVISKDEAISKGFEESHQLGKLNLIPTSQRHDSSATCEVPNPSHRFDCHPEVHASKSACEARGCCWYEDKRRTKPLGPTRPYQTQADMDIPVCFYPSNYSGYTMLSKTETDLGFSGVLQRDTHSYYPDDVMKLSIEVMYDTNTRLHVKIKDSMEPRYEVPFSVPKPSVRAPDPQYTVEVSNPGEPFYLTINSKGSGAGPVFSTKGTAPLIFADQFLQLSSILSSDLVYGIGEHRGDLLLDVNWTRSTLWNDDLPPIEGANLYGSHPFYLVLNHDGSSNGFFLLNSNAMDVVLQPYPAVTWRTIGGILDFYVFIGDSPADVLQGYTDVVGKPVMPPYWSLGFHICKFGYKSVNDTMAVTNRVRKAGIPQDVQWNDIDYADGEKDFTTDHKRFGEQAAMVQDIHSRGMHYVIITDPGISSTQPPGTYRPYDYGMELDLFVKNESGQPLVGKVWPGHTVWVDFLHPKAQMYWTTMIQEFHAKVPIDGLWIDMNEVSNFVNGSLESCKSNKYNTPPYTPAVYYGKLYIKTICPSALHKTQRSYNVHNIYGLKETEATYNALREIRGLRPFIISRSTFSGQGHYGGHWSGDNAARFHDMYRSISETLNFNMLGTPLSGVDICGFRFNATYNLCLRWHQLGAFYPYSRNHNNLGNTKPQDPAAFDDFFAMAVRKVLRTRYSLLPFLYTLFHRSHVFGYPVARAMFYEFPSDYNTHALDKQFMWGSCLLIAPVLEQYATTVDVYLPSTTWYNFYTGRSYRGHGNYRTFDAPLDTINLLVKAGSIIPMQTPALTTTESRKNTFKLLVAMTHNQTANGSLYWDDGDSLDTFERGAFNYIEFSVELLYLQSNVIRTGYTTTMNLGSITLYGCNKWPARVLMNGIDQYFVYKPDTQVLALPALNPVVNLLKPFKLHW